MRRFLIACVLAVLTLAAVGCHSTDDATRKAALGTIRDLRVVRSQVVTQLPDGDVMVGGKTWTVRGLWDNRLAAMIVRERSIVAGIDGDKKFSTAKAATEEGVTKEPR
jgi:hypothetical protein